MSEPLSILLHAAARGARWEYKYPWQTVWSECKTRDISPLVIRIRPKDKNLRYGPISRVLFEAAKNPPAWIDDIANSGPENRSACEFAMVYNEYETSYIFGNEEQRSFFLLLVAEALAHEGL